MLNMQSIQEKFKLRGLVLPGRNPKYQILTHDDIAEKEISKLVQQSMEILDGASAEDCQKLLYDFNWDYNKLLEKFTEADSLDDFLQKNKIDISIPLPPETMINSFIYSNPLFKKCPKKSRPCNFVVKVESADVEEILCECGYVFCFKCDNIPHSPFPCILVSEWVKQCKDFDLIFDNNNVICPHCFEVFDVENYHPDTYQGDIKCTNCKNLFCSIKNKLNASWVFPEFKYYVLISERLEKIYDLRDTLDDCFNAEFMSTVAKITENFLQRILPFPLFMFFVDKEYLSQHSASTANFVPMVEFSQGDLEMNLLNLMVVLELKQKQFSATHNALVYEKEQNNIMDLLHTVQQHLDKLSKFIEETKEWIFKIPEIQDAFDKINIEGDDYMEGCGNDDEDEIDDGESIDAEDESSDEDMKEGTFVYVE